MSDTEVGLFRAKLVKGESVGGKKMLNENMRNQQTRGKKKKRAAAAPAAPKDGNASG